MKRQQLIAAIAGMALAAVCLSVGAETLEPEVSPPGLPATGPLGRVGRGIKNIVVSPFEIPATMRRVAAERDPFFGLWAGGLEGLGNGLSRMTAGVIEVLTAPIPGHTLPFYTKRLGERASPPSRPPTGLTKP